MQQRGDRRGTRAFDDELRPLEQERDRLCDRVVLDVDDVVEKLVEDRHRQLARVLHGDAVGNRRAARLPRLHADDADARPQRAQHGRDPGGEPAAADRKQERRRVGHLLDELEPDRALARDHERVLERVHERRAGLLCARGRGRHRIVEHRAGEHRLGAVALRRLDLGHRRVLRHEDGRRDAELARGQRDRLPVVAGARGDHARGALGVAERRRAC